MADVRLQLRGKGLPRSLKKPRLVEVQFEWGGIELKSQPRWLWTRRWWHRFLPSVAHIEAVRYSALTGEKLADIPCKVNVEPGVPFVLAGGT